MRRCTNDGSEHYPRTDPAVIMSVVDADDRLLLARGPQWGEARYSVLAGFVEPGESLEAAVAREVREEVGVAVEDVRYLGNQPWPFPCSLMVGFTATAKDTTFRLDEDEIVEAIWVSREELASRGRGRPDRDLPAALDRPPADRALVRRRDRPAGRVDRPEPADRAEGLTMGDSRRERRWRSSDSATWGPWPR